MGMVMGIAYHPGVGNKQYRVAGIHVIGCVAVVHRCYVVLQGWSL